MEPHLLKAVLLWCLGINYSVLLIWFGVFVFAHDAIHRLHGRWFRLSVEAFDAFHYGAMAVYKVGVLLFNVAPLIALALASR
jgi:hypothetical protein